jgi:hypothetical protein
VKKNTISFNNSFLNKKNLSRLNDFWLLIFIKLIRVIQKNAVSAENKGKMLVLENRKAK